MTDVYDAVDEILEYDAEEAMSGGAGFSEMFNFDFLELFKMKFVKSFLKDLSPKWVQSTFEEVRDMGQNNAQLMTSLPVFILEYMKTNLIPQYSREGWQRLINKPGDFVRAIYTFWKVSYKAAASLFSTITRGTLAPISVINSIFQELVKQGSVITYMSSMLVFQVLKGGVSSASLVVNLFVFVGKLITYSLTHSINVIYLLNQTKIGKSISFLIISILAVNFMIGKMTNNQGGPTGNTVLVSKYTKSEESQITEEGTGTYATHGATSKPTDVPAGTSTKKAGTASPMAA